MDCPVPYRLSKRCFVSASLTAITGKARTPSFSIARRRTTPVVVSSVPPSTFGSRSARAPWSCVMRSAPSSIVSWGRVESTASMWR